MRSDNKMEFEEFNQLFELFPSCIFEPISNNAQILYKLLLDVLRSKYFDSFKNILEQHLKTRPSIIHINYEYPNTEDTLLDIASRNGLTQFVEFLLEKGADPNRVNVPHNRAPIHFATEGKHVNTLAALLNGLKTDPDLEVGSQTALHFAVINNDLKCADLLLEKGASASISNSMGLTPLHLAAIEGQRDMVQLILEKSKKRPNVDTYKDCTGKTTRKVIQENLDILLPEYESDIDVQVLKYYLIVYNETDFLESMELVKTEDLHAAAKELLKMAAQRRFYSAAIGILKKIKGEQFSITEAAREAVLQWDHVILEVLLQVEPDMAKDLIKLFFRNLLRHHIFGGLIFEEERANRLACLKLILEHENVNVRYSDFEGGTPLFYAAMIACPEMVDLLLDRGSYLGNNGSSVLPIALIPADTLSRYFDKCFTPHRNLQHAIVFNYRCLMPHDAILEHDETRLAAREMEVFKYIADDNGLKHLLKHPLLSSFLYLKWHRIRYILYANLGFYAIFYFVLNAYIFSITYDGISDTRMGSETQAGNSTSDKPLENTSRIVWRQKFLLAATVIMLLFFILREVHQCVANIRRYLTNLRNWLQITLIIFTVALLCGAGPQVGVIVILLSAWELMILISQHLHLPIIGIEMFQTVSFSFMRFLFPYLFLINAFALAFFTLFKDDKDNNDIYFSNPGLSFFRTVIMFTGEFDASDIPFDSYPFSSRIVFILFVFFIAIVLLNLLNGLAISNITEILSKIELIRLISQIRLIAYIEELAIAEPFGRRYSWYNLRLLWWYPFGFLINKIFLFSHYLKEGEIIVDYNFFDNTYSIFSIDHDEQRLILDPNIMKEVKRIIVDKKSTIG